uniref:NADH-ubiquinone oxidoreductase chain 1 n=1 Tax=Tyrophagus putrescentiae TaxID=59818 RepID=A0A0A7CD16_TYRPU|nr:NADH dehydrogenase subunit 1 [Tyrophagus putrescentiae]AIB08706.1 NADH dehydrogenase subunit 1 [Tyrophagus putrescentiae]
MYTLDFIISTVGMLLSVAFFTLMERKIMGLMHYRVGPNKVVEWGVSQPIADALKLLTKEYQKFTMSRLMMYYLGPLISLLLALLYWGFYEYSYSYITGSMKIMVIFSIMSLSAYGFLLTSWGSNSKYALLGGYRTVAQIISYEVCLMFLVLIMFYITKSYSVENIALSQSGVWFMLYSLPLFITWVMMCMAESSRTPFDHAESESELVSGYNVEYGGGFFVLAFVSEYGMIIFLSFITSMLFLGMNNMMLKTFLICIVYVWVRCAFPRVRYDKLMMMCWKKLLPYSLAMVALSSCYLL